jgi:hypothetical protein
MATRAEILVSLLMELNRFDEQLGALVRANRQHIAATGGLIADSFEQIAEPGPRRRHNHSFMPRLSSPQR